MINRVVRRSGPIDVHVISPPPADDDAGDRRLPAGAPGLTPLSPRRQLWGWLLVAAGLPLITLVCANLRDQVGLPSVLLLYLVLAMVVALVGGVLPAGVAVVGGFVLANWYFTPPFHQLTITDGDNALALVVYAVAAGIVALLVDRVGRSRLRAAATAGRGRGACGAGRLAGPSRARSATCSASCARRSGSVPPRCSDASSGGWEVLVASGPGGADRAPRTPTSAATSGATSRWRSPAVSSRATTSGCSNSFAAQLAAANERERLQVEAVRAADLAAANTLRAALLQAVSHDLRTPLASIKASISSLRQRDIEWPRRRPATSSSRRSRRRRIASATSSATCST